MQFIKKINLRTTGILIYLVYSLINWIFILLQYLYNSINSMNAMNSGIPIPTDYNYLSLVRQCFSPILFIAFLFALYYYNSKQMGKKALKIIGVLFLIFQCIFILFRLADINISHIQTDLIALIFYIFSLTFKIGFVLFIISKYKKVMFTVLSIGLLFSIYFSFDIVLRNISILSSAKYQNFLNSNTFNSVYGIISILLSILFILFSFLIWFYCYTEIKSNKKLINNLKTKEISQGNSDKTQEEKNEKTDNSNNNKY